MRGRPELEEWGRETLAQAEVTYVGSEHIRRVLADVVGEVGVVHEVPPGVDVDLFVLEDRPAALAALLEAARADPPNPGNAEERLPDEGNAERLEEFLAGDAPTVVYFGKLIEQKGVQVLLEAMQTLDARLVVVGFGPYRAQLEAMAPAAHALHRPARAPPPRASAAARRPRPSCPSVFPEAFGMVAAEAAAAGSPPARRAPLGPRRGRGGARGGVPGALPRPRIVHVGRQRRPRAQARSDPRALRRRPRRAASRGAPGRRRALVVASVAQRLLQPV